jgi:hypothetical protein
MILIAKLVKPCLLKSGMKYMTPIPVLLKVREVLESGKTKKEVENGLFFF